MGAVEVPWTQSSGELERRTRVRAVEVPTLLLTIGIYAGWVAVTFWHASLPAPLVAVLGTVLVAWHSSLQHEILHGHPTRSRRVNTWLGSPPLSIWLPYQAYRATHLVHHRDEKLTDPLDDPESYYWQESQWRSLSAIGRFLVLAQTTFAGRLIIGPAWNISRFFASQFEAVRRGERRARKIWTWHLVYVALLIVWLVGVCRMDLVFYVFAIVYPATSLLLVRSFAEHRAAEGVFERTAIVENSWILGPLFLFNNLHSAHHERPAMPWYRLPKWYRENRERLIAANGGLVYDTYFDVARRYLFTPHHRPLHPYVSRRERREAKANPAILARRSM